MRINWHVSWFWLNLGWFHGDPFKLIAISLGEAIKSYDGKAIDHITFIDITITHFTLAIGWQSCG